MFRQRHSSARNLAVILPGAWLLLQASLAAAGEPSPYMQGVVSVFRNAIVKIDVSTPQAVFKPGPQGESINICKSEGTGFLVSASHVVTAAHVVQLADECGKPNVVIKSKRAQLQKLATVMDAKDDVALLRIEGAFPAEMCALGLMAQDVYGVEALRFGIPGGWDQPGPPAGVTIDQKDGPFAPLTLLTPVITEKGESGGPIIYVFNVVGLTRARHEQYAGYSFMTMGSAIRALMAANSVRQSGPICNPVIQNMPTKFQEASTGGWLESLTGKRPNSTVIASINIDDNVSRSTMTMSPDLLDRFRKLGGNSVSVDMDSSGSKLILKGVVAGKDDEMTIMSGKVQNTSDAISQDLRQTLWNQFVDEGKKAGMWTGDNGINWPLLVNQPNLKNPAQPPI